MKKWVAGMLLLVIVLLGSVIGFNIFKQHMIANALANRPEPDYPVTAVDVKATNWTPTIEAIGFIDPNQGVNVSTQTAGLIKQINFQSGDKVQAGQVLVQLDDSVEVANLQASQAKLPAVRATYQRYLELSKTKFVSKSNLDEAKANYESLLAQIDSLKATIAHYKIRAPFSGIVGIRNVNLGQYLQPGTNIVRLEDVSVMKLRFTVPQTEISRIHTGQPIDIYVDAYPKVPFSGQITAIEPAVTAQSGLIEVQADIPNNDGRLRSGMFAQAKIILPTLKDQIVIPQTAVAFTLYGETVYVLKEKDGVLRAAQLTVKAGDRRGDSVHILDGLQAGERLVTTGQVRLSNDSKVHVVNDDPLVVPAQPPML
ncbi:efflux RND transporter periplasmic adaptor subunit [Plesiomonas shigelloides]|uniref:efflux RND transporter periplasmic adaptor subunit n=1 Tax=Plesiomonas shigelloides TaxID=703 RepID=UPI001C5B4A76|nr:efflux RND transporter periplasmic adaptor subunit [Plesiomonas shigelloides]MBW3792576.1 efflux RND transporter periplasmic adaptor subunit [Plesiomonas shigelloides]